MEGWEDGPEKVGTGKLRESDIKGPLLSTIELLDQNIIAQQAYRIIKHRKN